MKRSLLAIVGLVLVLAVPAVPAAGQGRGPKREFVTEANHAFAVTHDVLKRQGFEVVRMEVRGDDRVIYYRRGNMGRGRGKGPMMTMIIRRVQNRVVFVDTPDAILVDINVRLRL